MSASSTPFSIHPHSVTPRRPHWRIALTANIKDEATLDEDAPPDAGAEYDSRKTVEAIVAVLEADGHHVTICQADRNLPCKLTELEPDICFNIAEGAGPDSREAHVPALCALLDIPYTASGVLANALALDKAQTKRIWRSFNLPTPRFQEFRTGSEPISRALRYPLFVKPAREGTGMGITEDSVARNARQLRKRIGYVMRTYQQPVLVEEFMSGREFTVGYIGNRGPAAHRRFPELYDIRGYHLFPVMEIDTSRISTEGVYGVEAKSIDVYAPEAPGYLCPADIPVALVEHLYDLTVRAAETVGALDVARVDFRLDAEGVPHMLEINTLPGLNPVQSDLCIVARAEGMSYQTLITEILYLAAERYGLPTPEAPSAAL